MGLNPIKNPSRIYGRMVKAGDSGPKGPGFDSHEDQIFPHIPMDVMIIAPMTRLTLNRFQKFDVRI